MLQNIKYPYFQEGRIKFPEENRSFGDMKAGSGIMSILIIMQF